MKVSQVHGILDLAVRARKNGDVYNPLFVSNAGLGKSALVKGWAKERGYQVLDLRAALIEAPEVVGYPIIHNVDGRQRMQYATPEIWPIQGKWVIFLDEINRGSSSVMNAFMQLLTDRKILNYTLPEEAIIVSAINPENEMYDVNTMDTALKDRVEIFELSYDKKSFLQYIKAANWNRYIIMFVESGLWTYVNPEDVGNVDGNKYIAPRTLEKLNTAMKAGFEDEEQEYAVFESTLGKNTGRAFYNFIHKEYPILYGDLKRNIKESIEMLKKYSDPSNYKASYIALTIKSLIDEKVDDLELLSKVVLVIPADQGTTLIRELEYVTKNTKLLEQLTDKYPKVQKHFASNLKD